MSRPINTRLRFISSKNYEKIISYVNNLPYMIEKVNSYYCDKDKKHYFIFILPDDLDLKIEIISGNLD